MLAPLRRFFGLVLAFFCVLLTLQSQAQWSVKKLSQGRSSLSSAVVDTKVFFAGGATASALVDVYNNADQSMSTLTLSAARSNIAVASVGTKVFFAGGLNGTPTTLVDIYNNSGGTWTTANLSVARHSIAVATIGTKIFFAGGVVAGGGSTDVVDIYDNSNGNWSTTSLTQSRKIIGAATIGNNVLVLGETRIDIYDNTNGSWTFKSFVGPAIQEGSMAVLGTKLYVAGNPTGQRNNHVYVWDNTAQDWQMFEKLYLQRSGVGVTALGNKVLFAGGLGNGGPLDGVDVYDAGADAWGRTKLTIARYNTAAVTIGTRMIFAGGTPGASDEINIYDNSCSAPTVSIQPLWSFTSHCVGIPYIYNLNGSATYLPTGDGMSMFKGTFGEDRMTVVGGNVGRASVTGTTNGCFRVVPIDFVVSPTACPYFTNISPSSGPPGTKITITGGNFNPDISSITIDFNGFTAQMYSGMDNQLEAYVPQGATTGPITYRTGTAYFTSSQIFTVPCGGVNINVSGAREICAGESLQLNAQGASTYEWSPNVGLSATTGSIVTASPTSTTTYTVTGTTSGGCQGTKTFTIDVLNDCYPQITGFQPANGPVGTTVVIEGSNFHSSPGNNIVKFNGFTASVVSGTTTSITVIVPNGATTGKISVDKGKGATTSASDFVICSPPNITLSESTSICAGGSPATLNASGATTFSWSPPTGLSAVSGSQVTASPSQTTTYTVTGTTAGCSSTKQVTVSLAPCPQSRLGRFIVDYTSGCAPLTVKITNANVMTSGECTPGKPCIMDFLGNGTTTSTNQFTYTYTTPGTYKLSVLYQSIGADDVTIVVNGQPNVGVTSGSICSGQSFNLTANGANSFLWSTGATTSTITVSPTVTTTYEVTGTSVDGCTKTVSSTVMVTGPCTPLGAAIKEPTVANIPLALPVAVTLTGGHATKQVTLYHRKMRSIGGPFEVEAAQTVTTAEYSVDPKESWLDEFGMEYYFYVSDNNGQWIQTDHAYRKRSPVSKSIPNLSAGSSLNNYRIISIPRVLADQSLQSSLARAFEFYGGFDETKWRVARYKNGTNVTPALGLTKIEPGKGYWFLSVDPLSIVVAGQSLPVQPGTPFNLELDAGWTQIGNPFEFDISWASVKNLNTSTSTISNLYIFDSTTGGFRQSDNLKAWGGGFVNTASSRQLQIPVHVDAALSSSRTNAGNDENPDIDGDNWFVPLTVEQGRALHDMGGFGMNRNASIGRDEHDESALPRMPQYLDINFPHPEYFQPKFMRDVVPVADGHEWSFTVESNFDNGPVTLSWNKEGLAGHVATLLIYDPANGMIIDMKKSGSYTFDVNGRREMKILYGKSEKQLTSTILRAGLPYPNPFRDIVSLPFIASEGGGPVSVAIYDLTGRRIKTLGDHSIPSGYNEVSWDGTDGQGTRVASGVYIADMSDGKTSVKMRIVINK